jgi:asparagine synthase (glutamine-hydrolysing)
MREHFDEPFADFSFFPTFQISQVAAKYVKVALSGDGGDELFGGYSWYWNDRLSRRRRGTFQWAAEPVGALPASGIRVLRSAKYRLHNRLLDQLKLYARLLGALDEYSKRRYRAILEIPDDYDELWHFRRYLKPELPWLLRFQYLDFHTFLPDDVLTKVDRASMAVSLEVRVPFLDRGVIERAFSTPWNSQSADKKPKGMLRAAYSSILPSEILNRPKVGFGLPKSSFGLRDHCKMLTPQEIVLRGAYPEIQLSG